MFGGPGCGKSTFCSGLYWEMKTVGISCEIAPEYAKDLVWEGNMRKLDDQIYVFCKQLRRLNRLNGQVEVVLVDSPLPLSYIYGYLRARTKSDAFVELIFDQFDRFRNINFFLDRPADYEAHGRVQDAAGAAEIDGQVLDMMVQRRIPHRRLAARRESLHAMFDDIVNEIKNKVKNEPGI